MYSVLHFDVYVKTQFENTLTNYTHCDSLTQKIVYLFLYFDIKIIFYVQRASKWWSKLIINALWRKIENSNDICCTHYAYIYRNIIEKFTVSEWLKKVEQSYLDCSSPARPDMRHIKDRYLWLRKLSEVFALVNNFTYLGI